MSVLGVILAGGQARRMGGRDKALLTLGGETLLERAEARLGPQVDALAVNANGDPARLGTDLPVLPDGRWEGEGPLAGVLAGLARAETEGHEHVATVAVDTPFFPADLVARLREAAAPLACAATDRTHPTFGWWPVALRDALEGALEAGTRKIDAFTAVHGCVSATFASKPFDPFFNVNRPEDLARAEALAR